MSVSKSYANKTLVGNWWEDRYQPDSKAVGEPIVREPEEGIYAPRMKRLQPRDTSNTIKLTTESSWETTARSDFVDPIKLKKTERRREAVITHKNFNRALEARPVLGPTSGFGATLPRATVEPDEQRFFETTTGSAFNQAPPAVEAPPKVFKEEGISAGKQLVDAEGEKDVFPFVALKHVPRNTT
eukprot:TRINITY_DN218_c0_g1_i2.p1 TRINITY_DN218_c0_g1~~TRINITY_DN218_c0_g1_i2.p1  ORF type:complete len:185 (-),score=38.45 TRINITY_DN218_c0_g1_i2:345-899(-)